ncbi:hypothetical protein BCR35DRAFT_325199 [Leucosporidium creatinivorum]|uniref:DUF6534 domain-containing protein n=1 Tax=Leucosporidium creatinivorum TaxID=106004 RepID=A0A1Y2F9W7_9BASI|nr:hypothetical protein BCR35DRAFT_325199 [Leucosporidium creatinivorum]
MDVPAGPWATQKIMVQLTAPIYAGYVVATVLQGLALGRFISFFNTDVASISPSKRYKIYLIIVGCLLAVYSMFTFEEVCFYGTSQAYRSFEGITNGRDVSNVIPVLGGLISALVQGALMLRASVLFTSPLHRRIFCCGLGVIILGSFAGSVMVTAIGLLYVTNEELTIDLDYSDAVTMWLTASAAVDLFICLALIFNLRARQKGFNQQTDSILGALIKVALQSAAYTAVIAIAGAGFALGAGTSLALSDVTYSFYLPLPALYVLSLFTTMRSVETTRAIALPLPSLSNAEHTSSFVDVRRIPVQPMSKSGEQKVHRRRSSLAQDEDDELGGVGDEEGGSEKDLEKAMSLS